MEKVILILVIIILALLSSCNSLENVNENLCDKIKDEKSCRTAINCQLEYNNQLKFVKCNPK